jgi:hypothetical protein
MRGRERKMRKKREIITFGILALMTLLSALNVFAGPFKAPIKNLIIEPGFRAIFLGKLKAWIINSGSLFAHHVDELLLFNPSPYNNPLILELMGGVIKLVQPFYLLAIILLGFYLLFISGSPEERTKVKSALLRVSVSMILFTLSPLILNLLLTSSQSLSEAALSITGVEPIKEILLGGFLGAYTVIAWLTMPEYSFGANPWSYSLFFMTWFPYIFVSIRYIILTILEIIFPLTVFFYSFNYTRGIGRTLMESVIAWTFLQFFWVLVLVALALSANSLQAVFVENPTLGGFNPPPIIPITAIPGVGQGIAKGLGTEVDIFTLTFGIVGWSLIAALPFALVGLLRGYLP